MFHPAPKIFYLNVTLSNIVHLFPGVSSGDMTNRKKRRKEMNQNDSVVVIEESENKQINEKENEDNNLESNTKSSVNNELDKEYINHSKESKDSNEENLKQSDLKTSSAMDETIVPGFAPDDDLQFLLQDMSDDYI